ncbi:MAG: transcriptional regulator GutM [Anaerostipes sp.]|nr:transcriptional regulator GutM [Anaerostipes sp.]
MSGISTLLLVIFVLFCVQAIGGVFQVKDYRKAIKRVHQLGNVGVGQKRGRLFSGNIVMIACNNEGVITGAEIMEGLTFLTKFKETNTFLEMELKGKMVPELMEVINRFDKKQRKKYKGYVRAIEALDMRLNQGITL